MNNLQNSLQDSSKLKLLFNSIALTSICPTLWLMLGRTLDYDINVGQMMHPDLHDMDNLKFTIVAIEAYYGRAVSEVSSGYSCHLVVQVSKSSDDELVKTLPATFLLKAGS